MLTQFIRAFKKTGTDPIVDVSMENADQSGILWTFDKLYIAQKYPFNNFYLQMATASLVAGRTMTIKYWDGTSWNAAVDVLDFTKGLTRSGMVQFSLNRNDNWNELAYTDSTDTTAPEELRGANVDDCYWLEITLSGAPTQPDDDPVVVGTIIKRIAYAFTTTAKINGIDFNGPTYLTDLSLTNWEAQILAASEIMMTEMKRAGLIKAPGQIILLDDFSVPCAWRTLALIYEGMGKAYDDKGKGVMKDYTLFLGGQGMTIDKDMNARAEKNETNTTQSRLVR